MRLGSRIGGWSGGVSHDPGCGHVILAELANTPTARSRFIVQKLRCRPVIRQPTRLPARCAVEGLVKLAGRKPVRIGADMVSSCGTGCATDQFG
jgi:hypothetical protein